MTTSVESPEIAWRSVSQVKEYNDCGYRYKLHRIDKVWQRPAAWFPQGLGVHEAVEAFERSYREMTPDAMSEVYSESYDKHTNRLLKDAQNTSWWFRSGPYDGAKDIPRRYDLGLQQIDRYLTFTAKNPDHKPDVLDGELAVELAFETDFGGVPVRGVIDQVVKEEPVDVKSGNRPGDEFQLGTYAGALKKRYGIEPTEGAFWMGKSGKLTVPLDLRDWTEERLADVYGEADEGIKSEKFEPDPSPDKCRFCSVAMACSFAQ